MPKSISNSSLETIRDTFLPFAMPDIGDDELCEVQAVLESGWVTMGPKTRQFEQEFAAHVSARHAVAVNSCTAALHLALEAIDLGPGDLVITTPYTFTATAEVVRYFGAVPIFVDVEPQTLNIDPAKLACVVERIQSGDPRVLPRALRRSEGREVGSLKAVMPVHVAGLPTELDRIYSTASSWDLAVIEDAAHAFPSKYKGRSIGQDGVQSAGLLTPHMTCFSFYATKPITTGEGGMICTSDEQLAERCRLMALHGINRDAWNRSNGGGSWYYQVMAPGYKYNMTDLSAALGLAQLRKAEHMWQHRCAIAQRYNKAFIDIPELALPADRLDCQHAWHLYMLRLNLDRLQIDRRQFIEELGARNIAASVHFIPLHLHPYYRDTFGYSPKDFPVAYREYQREVSLPIYSKMTDQDVRDVIDAVVDVVDRYAL